MNEQLLAAIEHDEHREARLGNRRTAHQLALLRAEIMRAWSEHDIEPVKYIVQALAGQPKQLAHLAAGFADEPDERRRYLKQYTRHYRPADDVAVLRVKDLTPEQTRLQQLASAMMISGGIVASVAFIASFIISIFALFILPGLLAFVLGVGTIAQLNGRRRTQELVSNQQAQLEASSNEWEKARRDAHHALDRDHPMRVTSTQYAVMVDTIDDQTRVMLVQYRPTTSGYNRRVVQNRRFDADEMHRAITCKSLLERRAERYEREARERSGEIMDAVNTRQLERRTDEESKQLARIEAAQLAQALGGRGTTVAPRRLQ